MRKDPANFFVAATFGRSLVCLWDGTSTDRPTADTPGVDMLCHAPFFVLHMRSKVAITPYWRLTCNDHVQGQGHGCGCGCDEEFVPSTVCSHTLFVIGMMEWPGKAQIGYEDKFYAEHGPLEASG